MAAAFGVLQVPVLFAAEHFGDAAAEVHRDILEQAARDGTHAGDADPADLLVGGGGEFAIAIVVQLGFPLRGPARRDPLLHLLDEAPVAGGEVLGAQVERADLAALAGHAPAAAMALVEQVDGLPGLLQGLGGRQAGDTGTNDGNWNSHDGLFEPCCVQPTLLGKPVQCTMFV